MTLTEDQLRVRLTAITATDVAALCGADPYRTSLDVWLAKTGRSTPDDDTGDDRSARITWSHRLEPLLRADFAERHGVRVVGPVATVVRGFGDVTIAATPDGIVPDWGTGWEAKTHSVHLRQQYGDEGTDQIPLRELFQCQTGMLVTGLTAWRLTVFMDGLPHDYSVSADPQIHESIVEMAGRWWRDHVVADRCPPLTGEAATHKTLAGLYPNESGLVRQATEEERILVLALRRALRDGKDAEMEVERLKAEIKSTIGDDAGLQWSEDERDRITWRKSRQRRVTDWQSCAFDFATEVQLHASHELVTALAEAYPPVAALRDSIKVGLDVDRYTEIAPGSRRFLMPRSWGGK